MKLKPLPLVAGKQKLHLYNPHTHHPQPLLYGLDSSGTFPAAASISTAKCSSSALGPRPEWMRRRPNGRPSSRSQVPPLHPAKKPWAVHKWLHRGEIGGTSPARPPWRLSGDGCLAPASRDTETPSRTNNLPSLPAPTWPHRRSRTNLLALTDSPLQPLGARVQARGPMSVRGAQVASGLAGWPSGRLPGGHWWRPAPPLGTNTAPPLPNTVRGRGPQVRLRRGLAGGQTGGRCWPRCAAAATACASPGPAMEPGPPAIREGWFRETCSLWPGQAMSLQVDELLHHQRSRYQEILVFRSKTYGNVLVLDGVIQCTERDEFSYQEMIANLPLCSHPSPRKVLIIGGGDGGVLREVVKHPSVESVVQCEIDEDVIQVSKKYLPGMAVGYSSPKLTLHVRDGFEFMQQNQDAFDVIITDSSDPMGPAESLFKESYYQLMKTALKDDGILCCQGECQWLHLDLIKEMRHFCKSLFPVVEYAYCTIPTYPSGQIGFMLCSKTPSTNFREPVQQLTQEQVEKMNLKYYNSDIHRAAFVLPEFARKALSDV